MTPAPTESRERAVDALDRIDNLLDRLDEALVHALDELTTTTEEPGDRPPDPA